MASPRNAASDRAVPEILSALDLAVFERRTDGFFRNVAPLPQWFASMLDESADPAAIDLMDAFPFLESFLAECESAVRETGCSQSDIWTERDRDGQYRHLQALAMNIAGQSLLIFEPSTGAYTALQRAHDRALESERIERLRRELARLNEELKARNAEVERATRAKSDFLAAMSHEIRTPMNAIIGMADLLSQTPLTPDQRKYVEVFQRAGENLLNLINDILDLSKVEAGQIVLEVVEFDLAEVVARATEIIQVKAAPKGLTVRYRILAGVPARLTGDPGRLQQVLINLLGNSMKFTEKGGLEVTVDPDPQSNESGRLRFAVADTGIGIPADKLDVIFENFVQADSSTTRKYGGTGLGLSISRQLVTLMHGRIWVESTVGVGSTFYFTASFAVPSQQAALLQAPAESTKAAASQLNSQLARGLQILLADDSEDNRFLILSYLKGTDCSVDIAENGRLATEKFEAAKYDLVLMDVEMPEMDGYTATRLIRERERAEDAKPTPILALTAHAFAEAVRRSLDAGFTAHLTKPIRKATLLEAIARHAPEARAESRPAKIHVTVDASLQDLIPGYLAKRTADAARAAEALAAGDYDTVRRFGHNLKGTGAGYGFPALTEMGAAIEDGAKTHDQEMIQYKLDELMRYLEQVEWSAASGPAEG